MTQYWIDKDKILGSSNPTTEQLKELHKRGFRTIISLLDEDKERPNYNVKAIQAMGYKQYSIPIKDSTAPTLKQFEQFLRIVKQTPSSIKIVVQCGGGLGRTATMGAAYWMKKDLSAEDAVKKIRSANPKAIETKEQEQSLHELEARIESIDC
nr:dual specificity protein phosphatase family protein [Candidatus Njordarchaeum guaymaensis]